MSISQDYGDVRRLYQDHIEPRLTVDLVYSGLQLEKQGPRYVGLCPVHEERTPSFFVFQDLGFHCFGCGANGTALDALNGFAAATGRSFFDTVKRAAHLVGVDLGDPGPAPLREVRQQTKAHDDRKPSPSNDELEAFYRACVPIDQSESAKNWLAAVTDTKPGTRQFEVYLDRLLLWDACRAIGRGQDCPPWATCGSGKPWGSTPNKILVPRYTVDGAMASFQRRSVVADQPKYKSLSPAANVHRWPFVGTCFANSHGLSLLRGEPVDVTHVAIVEGEKDFLATLAATAPQGDVVPAVFGFAGGGTHGTWDVFLSGKLPSHITVVLATDHDARGDAYARHISDTLDECGVPWVRV